MSLESEITTVLSACSPLSMAELMEHIGSVRAKSKTGMIAKFFLSFFDDGMQAVFSQPATSDMTLALLRLEQRNVVTSEFLDGPRPRTRVYKLAPS